MSFAYRPTPVVVLAGKTVGSDHVPMRRLPAGTMRGYVPNMASPALNAIGRRTIGGNPWLVRSGTMGSFLGQDDDEIDTTSIDLTGGLVAPSLSPIALAPIDTGGIDTSLQPTMEALTGSFVAPTVSPISISSQGVTAQAAIPASGISAVINSIANLFKPATAATPMTATQPGVYSAYTAQPSILNQSSILPGVTNSTLLVGVIALAILGAVMGKK